MGVSIRIIGVCQRVYRTPCCELIPPLIGCTPGFFQLLYIYIYTRVFTHSVSSCVALEFNLECLLGSLVFSAGEGADPCSDIGLCAPFFKFWCGPMGAPAAGIPPLSQVALTSLQRERNDD